ncbi:MAG TPA: glucose-6-phosphate dehydrogenase [Actinomycetota bacterium]|nr:glucose-6-phosphate dehydrogenase [Actinomycetota bacterium]
MRQKLAPPDPSAVVIFGASGDLTHRKLLPALYHLFVEGLLPASFGIVGYARTELNNAQFREMARDSVARFGRTEPQAEPWDEFAKGLYYVPGEFTDEGAMSHLRRHLQDLDRERGTEGRRFYYAATPPAAFPDIVARIGEEGMAERARIVIEKPFGTDLQSARDLGRLLHEVFDESQVFRIDHYLGKETVQNILVFRFANSLFEPLWNRRYVDHVELSVCEDIGIEGRGRFYERTGALRDMVQTHLFQVLSFLTMEPPVAFQPERLRDEKVKVFQAIADVRPEDVVRGQYRGYRDEDGVASDSDVETFAALRLEIDNWRWAGVPFYLRTGKRLSRRVAQAVVEFKDVPHRLFEKEGLGGVERNRLAMRIQPDEGIVLSFTVQAPGLGITLEQAGLDFEYGEAFEGRPLVEAYEALLLEAMHGDHTMFLRQDGLERAWEVLDPAFRDPPPVQEYEPGTWGPAEADAMIAPRRWALL